MLESVVGWLDSWYAGPVLRVVLALGVVFLPFAQAYSGSTRHAWLVPIIRPFQDPEWVFVLMLCALALIPLQHYRRGSPITRLVRQLGDINGSFAGGLISYGEKCDHHHRRKLDDAQCEALCVGFLHRIRDYTALALGEGKARLRANLAVPYAQLPEGPVDSLRVWCYDETHADDASEPNFFILERVIEDAWPLIGPAISAIGLVLSSRQKKGQPYDFPL